MRPSKIINASRPFLWVNTAVPFALGWLLVRPMMSWYFVLGFIFFLFPYNLLLYGINDIFDYESDIKNPRKASIEGAALRKIDLLHLRKYIVLFSVPFIMYLFFKGTIETNTLLVFSLFMVVAYSMPPFRFKEIPFLDSFTSSMHFVTPLAFGLAVAGASLFSPFAHIVPIIVAYMLWGMASHAFGAIQDIQFDRQADIASIATVLGARSTVLLSSAAYIASAVIILFTFHSVAGSITAVSLLLFGLNTIRFYNVTDASAETTRSGWRFFLTLCLSVGALFVTGWISLFLPFGIKQFPSWAPFVISVVTYFFSRFFLRS